MKKLIVFAIVSLLLSACENKNDDFPKTGESRHKNWTLEYQTMVGELYFCTYTRASGHRGYAFTTPSETPCRNML